MVYGMIQVWSDLKIKHIVVEFLFWMMKELNQD